MKPEVEIARLEREIVKLEKTKAPLRKRMAFLHDERQAVAQKAGAIQKEISKREAAIRSLKPPPPGKQVVVNMICSADDERRARRSKAAREGALERHSETPQAKARAHVKKAFEDAQKEVLPFNASRFRQRMRTESRKLYGVKDRTVDDVIRAMKRKGTPK